MQDTQDNVESPRRDSFSEHNLREPLTLADVATFTPANQPKKKRKRHRKKSSSHGSVESTSSCDMEGDFASCLSESFQSNSFQADEKQSTSASNNNINTGGPEPAGTRTEITSSGTANTNEISDTASSRLVDEALKKLESNFGEDNHPEIGAYMRSFREMQQKDDFSALADMFEELAQTLYRIECIGMASHFLQKAKDVYLLRTGMQTSQLIELRRQAEQTQSGSAGEEMRDDTTSRSNAAAHGVVQSSREADMLNNPTMPATIFEDTQDVALHPKTGELVSTSRPLSVPKANNNEHGSNASGKGLTAKKPEQPRNLTKQESQSSNVSDEVFFAEGNGNKSGGKAGTGEAAGTPGKAENTEQEDVAFSYDISRMSYMAHPSTRLSSGAVPYTYMKSMQATGHDEDGDEEMPELENIPLKDTQEDWGDQDESDATVLPENIFETKDESDRHTPVSPENIFETEEAAAEENVEIVTEGAKLSAQGESAEQDRWGFTASDRILIDKVVEGMTGMTKSLDELSEQKERKEKYSLRQARYDSFDHFYDDDQNKYVDSDSSENSGTDKQAKPSAVNHRVEKKYSGDYWEEIDEEHKYVDSDEDTNFSNFVPVQENLLVEEEVSDGESISNEEDEEPGDEEEASCHSSGDDDGGSEEQATGYHKEDRLEGGTAMDWITSQAENNGVYLVLLLVVVTLIWVSMLAFMARLLCAATPDVCDEFYANIQHLIKMVSK